jgi:hypothetical protein
MLGTTCPLQHSVTSQKTWSQHYCCDTVYSHLFIGQYKVCWNLQTLCWLRPDALQDLFCICVLLCLWAVVILALWVFSHVSVLCGQLLCFFRDHEDFLASKAAASPVIIFKARCEKAEDYTKRKHVFRWCVWIVWLLVICPSKSQVTSIYFSTWWKRVTAIVTVLTVLCLRQLVTSLSAVRPELDHRPGPVRFIVASGHCDRSFCLRLVSPCQCCFTSAS